MIVWMQTGDLFISGKEFIAAKFDMNEFG